MTGLGDKVAQMLLSRLLKTGLVRFGLPQDALRFYFRTCTLKQGHDRMRTRLQSRCYQESGSQ